MSGEAIEIEPSFASSLDQLRDRMTQTMENFLGGRFPRNMPRNRIVRLDTFREAHAELHGGIDGLDTLTEAHVRCFADMGLEIRLFAGDTWVAAMVCP